VSVGHNSEIEEGRRKKERINEERKKERINEERKIARR
jgi:hypothetical protein